MNGVPARWPLVVLPVAALLLEAIAFVALWWLADEAYGAPRDVPLAFERPAGRAMFAVGGVVAGALALVGLYRTHRQVRPWIAFPVTLVVYLPLLAVATVASYVLVILLNWL